MSLYKAIELMTRGNLVVHKSVAYAIIDERICACRYDKEKEAIESYYEIESSINVLAMLFDTFVSSYGVNVFRRPSVPEFYVVEQGQVYDFSKMPDLQCPVCLSFCNRTNVKRDGRNGHCFQCNRQLWTASRYDGVKDVSWLVPTLKKLPKPEKPKPPTDEEIITAVLGDETKQIRRKIRF